MGPLLPLLLLVTLWYVQVSTVSNKALLPSVKSQSFFAFFQSAGQGSDHLHARRETVEQKVRTGIPTGIPEDVGSQNENKFMLDRVGTFGGEL